MKNERGLFFVWVHWVAHGGARSRRSLLVRLLRKEENEMVGMTGIIRSLQWCMIMKDGFVFGWTSYKGRGCLALVVLWFATELVWWLVFPSFLKKKKAGAGVSFGFRFFLIPFAQNSPFIKTTTKHTISLKWNGLVLGVFDLH